jgi:hypothetical protein
VTSFSAVKPAGIVTAVILSAIPSREISALK